MKLAWLKKRMTLKYLVVKNLGLILAGMAIIITTAQAQAPAPAAPAVLPDATDQQLLKRWEERFPGMPKPDRITKTPFAGLYEVGFGTEIFYTDDKVAYVFDGQLIDASTQRNLTQERIEKLSAVKFSELPLELAIKSVKGNGARKIAIFEDPNCGYCKQFRKTLSATDNITVYSFLYPVLSPDSVRIAKQIWCTDNRAQAWDDWMLNGKLPAAKVCDTPIDKVLALGQKLKVRGTPTIIFSDDSRVPGALPADKFKAKLDSLASKSLPKSS